MFCHLLDEVLEAQPEIRSGLHHPLIIDGSIPDAGDDIPFLQGIRPG